MYRRKWIGAPLRRKEDFRFLTGSGSYIEDITMPGMVYAVLVRSPRAHARIKRIDVSRAARLSSVVDVVTGEDVARDTRPLGENLFLPEPGKRIKDYCMAVDKAVFVGHPVAAVVATDIHSAADAAELVNVEYEPLPIVVDPEAAMKPGAAIVHEDMGTNVGWQKTLNYGDVDGAFREADRILEDRLHWHRFSSASLETLGVVASYDKISDSLTIISNNQRPTYCLAFVSRALNFPPERTRVSAPDIGGGFGNKVDTYNYMTIIAYLSKRIGRPVKWIESRREHMMASIHGNEVICYAQMAVKNDGRILGLKFKMIHDEGAFMRREPVGALNMLTRHGSSVYAFRNLRGDIYCVITNKCPVGPNRSYGKMQQCWILERLIDRAARELGIDAAEVRLRNFVPPEQMPYTTPSGAVLDGGDYPKALKRLLELIEYQRYRREQEELRKKGRYIGIGIGVGMDANPVNFSINILIDPDNKISGDTEAASLRIAEGGRIVVATGSVPQGQGHETIISQVVADELGVNPEDVNVLPRFDSLTHPFSAFSGTYASRFAVMGLGAVQGAVKKVREKALAIAAHVLEARIEDLEFRDGKVVVKGTDKSITLAEVAHIAWRNILMLPKGMEPGLQATYVYTPNYPPPTKDGRGNFSLTYYYSIHGAVVEVDVETGHLDILKYVSISDPGIIINPLIVKGQIHGGLVHQLGAALYERFLYDENGQLLTASYMEYLPPTAAEIPSFESEFLETPSLFSPYKTRGCGEGGGSPISALTGAVEDALAPLGIKVTSSYMPPQYIYQLIKESGSGVK